MPAGPHDSTRTTSSARGTRRLRHLPNRIAVHMLYTDEERAVMAHAIQPNMRAAKISQTPFRNIIADYISENSFKGARVLDIGPGQLDFLDIARELSATSTTGVDFDPAIKKLGELRGHEVHTVDFRQKNPFGSSKYDLIFCRGSINCFWFATEERLSEFLQSISDAMSATARIWIAPWNKPASGQEEYAANVNEIVNKWVNAIGASISYPPASLQARYGIGFTIPLVQIWSK